MAWSAPMPLTIAQPRSARYDELAEIAWSRRQPMIDDGAPEFGQWPPAGAGPKMNRGPRSSFVCYQREFQPRMLALLLEHGEMGTTAIHRALAGLRRAQCGNLLYRARLAGLLEARRAPEAHIAGHDHENLWRLTDAGRAAALEQK